MASRGRAEVFKPIRPTPTGGSRRWGRDVFYRGEIADEIDAFMRAHGGFLRKVICRAHLYLIDPAPVNTVATTS